MEVLGLLSCCGALVVLQCKQKSVDFRIRYDSLLPQFAYTDENRLKQIILRTQPSTTHLDSQIAMLSGSGKLQVSEEDIGMGIPTDKQQSLFTMFGKVDSSELNPWGVAWD